MARKSEGLNKPQMEMTLRKLAKLHAASAVDYDINGPYDHKFSRGVYNADMKDIFGYHYDFNFTFVIDNFFSKWPNLDSKIIDKMVRPLTHLPTFP
jgi:hypothetical protein